MLTKGIEVIKYIRASAGKAGLSVVFEEINSPRHDGKTIYLPRITAHTTEEDLMQLMASTDHEVAHDRFSDFDLLKKEGLGPQEFIGFVWNFLEDSRINNIEAREYRGFRENWDVCASSLLQKILEKAKDSEDKIQGEIVPALIRWETVVSAVCFPLSDQVTQTFEYRKDILDVLNNYSADLVDCQCILNKEKGSKATLDLARKILEDLQKIEDIKEYAEKQIEKKVKAKGEKDSASKEQDKGEEEEGEECEAKHYSIAKVKLSGEDYEKMATSIPESSKTPKKKMGKTGLNLEIEGPENEEWHLTDPADFAVIDYPRSLVINCAKTVGSSGTGAFLIDYQTRVKSRILKQENFAQQIRRLIQIRAKVQRVYGVKKGKLDQSRLSRISFKAPGISERIFKNTIENKTLDVAISVLVDMSGSMSGDKCYNAVASAVLMNEVCSTLGVPLEITGFTDCVHTRKTSYVPLMYIYKAFSDLKIPSEDIEMSFAKSSGHMLGNPDGENILWAYDRLLKRKEKNRLLIVMSDGTPAASRDGRGIEGFTAKVIEEIEAANLVSIFGLGLCHTAVSGLYKHHAVIFNPAAIPEKLLELIERKILSHVYK